MFCIAFMLYFEMTFKLVISDTGKNKLREYLLTISIAALASWDQRESVARVKDNSRFFSLVGYVNTLASSTAPDPWTVKYGYTQG